MFDHVCPEECGGRTLTIKDDVSRKRNLAKQNAEDEHPREINAEEVSRSTGKENSVVDWWIVADGICRRMPG